MPKVVGNNRGSALKRLSNPYSINNLNRRSLIGSKVGRQITVDRNTTSFDARQLLTRQSSKTEDNNNEKMVVITGLKDMKIKDGRLISTPTVGSAQLDKKKKIVAVGPTTLVTIRNSNNPANTSSVQMTGKTSLTKTIKNPSVNTDNDESHSQSTDTLSSLSNQKFVISFVNDKYEKTPTPPPPATKPSSSFIHHRDSSSAIKRSHDASIQTTSSTRSPIRMSSYRRQNSSISDQRDNSEERTIGDDLYEPPVKRTNSSTRKTTTEKEHQVQSTVSNTGSVKRTSTGVPVSSRMTSSVSTVPKPSSTIQPASTSGTILVTNLQSSVTEDDVMELFGQVGRITEIKTLSEGCIRIVYAKREYSEQAVAKYHNRLLDGQFMYVSLQQSTPQNPKPTSSIQQSTSQNPKSTSSIQQSTKDSTTNQPLKFNASAPTSNKFTIDPTFFRQALFHPSNNSTNPVQFQVKL